MASFWINRNDTNVTIPTTENIGTVTYYNITVNVSNVQWKVSHRYNEFYDLHNKLVIDHGVSKDILPKKVIRNKCPMFIEIRRSSLETYLQNILIYLKQTMPRIFLEFLHFHTYDTFFLLQNFAAEIFLSNIYSEFEFNVLQLHAISIICKTPLPVPYETDNKYDLSNVLDLCSCLVKMKIIGMEMEYRKSNIIPNKLHFDFCVFREIRYLEILDLNLNSIQSFGNLRETVEHFTTHNTSAINIAHILQCDILHKSNLDMKHAWLLLKKLDLSNNQISEIDESIKLVPNLECLILNYNKIIHLPSLSDLSKLKHLHLSQNLILNCDQLHTKVGNLSTLDLSQNYISALDGFSKLYSLISLDVSCNKIVDIDKVKDISELPCLENLVLTGNSVATLVDYRVKVFEYFGDQAPNLCLDNEKPSQAEVDKALILRALRIVKEGRLPQIH